MSVNVSKKGNIDFTKGSIIRNLILFFVPIVLGELFQNYFAVRGQIREKITAAKAPV